ncbi:MAG: 3-phosphoserine/phosphohydroxythreonine transaminase [Fimbriimonadaceae bacterium]|jgi:phosphoserine aminotransferase|nr:3-phosphoserine/phosphohydroxythreonine transaminase [Fimbriimonadaceae bacterium]
MSERILNFSAGPGAIPVPVLERARDEMVNWQGAGMSVMEMSHRGKAFLSIAQATEEAARKLMGIPSNYKVLFLQGGASLQFTMLANAFLNTRAEFVVTGAWGQKALQAGKMVGESHVTWDGKAHNYDRAPKFDSLDIDSAPDFVHITMNETIQGVDFLTDPDINENIVCDMSSCIASRPFDVSKYSLIYAGAQKNLGPSGVTLVILSEDFLATQKEGLHPMLDYRVQAENESMYNTPPCWGIYVMGLVFQHWLDFGGLEAVAAHNEKKAKLIYDAIDGSGGFYRGHAQPENRSLMNIPFVLPDESLTEKFLAETKANQMVELKGHRSVGGCRASVYNAFPMEGAKALADFMGHFARQNG